MCILYVSALKTLDNPRERDNLEDLGVENKIEMDLGEK
jgi:hypothetical protein